jgi:hypothetical protein
MMTKPFSRISRPFLFLSVLALLAGCGGGGGSTGGTGDVVSPTITSQPADQNILLGYPAAFSVTASGTSPNYQWQSLDDDGATWNIIIGATASTYAFTPTEKKGKSFRCIVTNSAGSATSDKAELTVAKVVYVNKEATGGNNGTSWTDAYTDLQDALLDAGIAAATAVTVDEIWVAKGTYKPIADKDSVTDTDRGISFELARNVGLYGGFAGNEPSREARNWKDNVTILSGEIGDQSDILDNSIMVVTFNNLALYASDEEAWTATLDGFTITAGSSYAGPASFYASGGGMRNNHTSPVIANCTFTENYGHGLSNEYYSSPIVTNCTFTGNTTNMVCAGGGVVNHNYSSPVIFNCAFSGNYDRAGGGMTNSYYSAPNIVNCTFTSNGGWFGGAMWNVNSAAPTITNCILWGNTASSTNAGIYNEPESSYYAPSNPTVTYSCIQDGYTGTGNLDQDPLFTSSPAADSLGKLGGGTCDYGDLRLLTDSPCINAGSAGALDVIEGAIGLAVDTDLAGNPRMGGGSVDLGAYEYQQ